ncbi:hypothetical protein Hdeb2414_s1144g00985381 [Helianthus debilis subsp. tardiflorus]
MQQHHMSRLGHSFTILDPTVLLERLFKKPGRGHLCNFLIKKSVIKSNINIHSFDKQSQSPP